MLDLKAIRADLAGRSLIYPVDAKFVVEILDRLIAAEAVADATDANERAMVAQNEAFDGYIAAEEGTREEEAADLAAQAASIASDQTWAAVMVALAAYRATKEQAK
jgi:hypothetical protein